MAEYPACSLHLLGNERVVKELVHKFTMPQILRNDGTGEEYTGKLFTRMTDAMRKGCLSMTHS